MYGNSRDTDGDSVRKASARAEAQDTMYTRAREKGKVIVVAATALYSTVQHTNGYRQPEERVRERGSARATVSSSNKR